VVEEIAPYTRHFYPGRHSVVQSTLPRKVAWQAVQIWNKTGSIPADVAAAWVEWLERSIERRTQLIAELRLQVKKPRRRAPEGWRTRKQ